MNDMKKQFPKIGEILIHERDQYLAAKIKEAPGKKVVAILGGAHVPGVKEEIYKEQDIEYISNVPKKSIFSKVIGWAIPAIILGLFLYGFVINIETGLQQLKTWVLFNGIFAAAFTTLAMGHPFSILTSFVVAPISSLNPLLACGWFTGLVEASIRKPTVQDIHDIPTDVMSFKGYFRNRFLRILLIGCDG